ncbi:MAG: hypothetical protein SOX26_03475 [Phocaeicola sp.]|nr:hypothetical protein [Phocaeicola sp.]
MVEITGQTDGRCRQLELRQSTLNIIFWLRNLTYESEEQQLILNEICRYFFIE